MVERSIRPRNEHGDFRNAHLQAVAVLEFHNEIYRDLSNKNQEYWKSLCRFGSHTSSRVLTTQPHHMKYQHPFL